LIGRRVLLQLTARDDEILALTRSTTAAAAPSAITWVQGDVLDPASIALVIDRHRPTHLLHLAWTTTPGAYWTSGENDRWMAGSGALFEQFTAGGGERIVAAGSCAEYDWTTGTFAEGEAPRPATPYGRAKDATRIALSELAERRAISHAWGRVFFLYGPGEHAGRFLPSLAVPLLRGEPAWCRKPSLVRDWLYVDDVAAAFVALLDAPVSGAVNISSGCGITLAAFAGLIAEAAGHAECLRLGDEPPESSELAVIIGAPERLAPYWQPAVSITDGVARAVAWWRRQDRPPDSVNPEALRS
jgi:nucleoside-diphosphate-sugar epimerase